MMVKDSLRAKKIQLGYYLSAEIIGALLGSLFVKYLVGNNANLGANAPNYAFPIPVIFGIEVLASALLMVVILIVVYTNGSRAFGAIAISGIVGLEKTELDYKPEFHIEMEEDVMNGTDSK